MATHTEIDGMTASEIKKLAEETVNVKGYDVNFVNIDGSFGYSAVFTYGDMHIRFADDFQLHHPSMSRDELRTWYIDRANDKLFTDDELLAPCTDHQEIERRKAYIRDYYSTRRPYVSMFGDAPEWWDECKDKWIFSWAGCAYYAPEDKDFVERMEFLYNGIDKACDPLADYDSAFKAFKYEMYNHEYPINWQGDWDVINCFCKVDYKGDVSEIDQTGWSDEIKKAYLDAARYVQKHGEW